MFISLLEVDSVISKMTDELPEKTRDQSQTHRKAVFWISAVSVGMGVKEALGASDIAKLQEFDIKCLRMKTTSALLVDCLFPLQNSPLVRLSLISPLVPQRVSIFLWYSINL